MRIILVGGGTLGSVMPLIAVYQKLKERVEDLEVLWIGAKGGPEERIVRNYLIDYKTIIAGKVRRYFDWRNFLDVFKTLIGFLESLFIILTFKPDLIMGAGIFLQVPIMFAGKVLNKKILIHQQDLKKSLSNKLCEKIADKITVVFEKNLADFNVKKDYQLQKFDRQRNNKVVLTGNPYRREILNGDITQSYKIFNLKQNLPTILILGGGTGSRDLNKLINESLMKLTLICQIIHLTGKNKQYNSLAEQKHSNYHSYEFLTDDLKYAYSASDIIISRAGLSTLTELSSLAKPVILIPLPGSHQENNAQYFKEKNAALILNQKKTTANQLADTVKKLLGNRELRFQLSVNINKIMPHNADESIVKEITKLLDVEIEVKRW